MPAPVNLVSAESIGKRYDVRPVIDAVSIGIAQGERIGVVGPNGGGKSTLLRLLAKVEEPDTGRVAHTRGLEVALVDQHDDGGDRRTVHQTVVGDRAEYEWARRPDAREMVTALLDGIGWEATTASLSGGERRRVKLAAALMTDPDLLLLDEPTNHLDLDGIAWLAGHLARRRGTLVVVTHDRWFLDEVATTTWDVVDAGVTVYDGGYAAHVLAKAERERTASVAATKRANLLRKELAWLQRGAPARTSKPKFRIEEAEALIADEPAPRDRLELTRFATARLGKQVIEVEDATVRFGERTVLSDVTMRLGAGDRVGVVGRNGSGKSTLLALMAGEIEPATGRVVRGKTVSAGHLSQSLTELDPARTVRQIAERERLWSADLDWPGRPVSAVQLLERFGFGGGRMSTRVGELSGGERRRLALLRLLMGEPNVLLLDEPTNDLDIDTLTVLEDFLDSWPGTMVVVSHDRYLLERMCDTVWGVRADGSLVLWPRGVDDYLADARSGTRAGGPIGAAEPDASVAAGSGDTGPGEPGEAGEARLSAAQLRQARKDLAALERTMSRLRERLGRLERAQAQAAQDYQRLLELAEEHRAVEQELAAREEEWLALADEVEQAS